MWKWLQIEQKEKESKAKHLPGKGKANLYYLAFPENRGKIESFSPPISNCNLFPPKCLYSLFWKAVLADDFLACTVSKQCFSPVVGILMSKSAWTVKCCSLVYDHCLDRKSVV